MKTKVLLCILWMILTMVMNVVEVQGQELTVSDTENSGCLLRTSNEAEAEQPIPTIILEKEGNILSVQLLNYYSNCATQKFSVKSSLSEGKDDLPVSLSVKVSPVTGDMIADCICPYNVSFVIRDLEQNKFYLDCWWYKGQVELTEQEPLVLADVKENVTIDGMNYTLRKAFHYAMVKKNDWSGEVCIPSELSYDGKTYYVTSIANDAFSNNTALTKVIIPRTVNNIDFGEARSFDNNLFYGCTALESIEVDEENPVFCTVDGVLFNKEKTKLLSFPAADNRTSYIVPESVNSIAGLAFWGNQHLVTVSLHDQVSSLGSSVFYGCTKLEDVKMPSNLTVLAGWMFANCEHLKSMTIPDGVTYLGINLFSGCTSLISVTMPKSVISADYSTFENCKSLKHVTLSPNLDKINYKMFLNCSSLSEIHLPEGITSIDSYAFQNCTALKTLDIPESVRRFGDSPFSGCKLESLWIRGIIDSRWINYYVFKDMGTQTVIYVQPSEVEKYQNVYKGKVCPLSDQTNRISNTISPNSDSSKLYDLQGRRIIGEPKRGIVIQNGKKHVVK